MSKIRLQITKNTEIRYISHLDYARTLERAIRRADIPVAYSQGFNPHMKLAFASALAVGVTSSTEYLDIELTQAACELQIVQRLKEQVPKGVEIVKAKTIPDNAQALMAVVNLVSYSIIIPKPASEQSALDSIRLFNAAPAIMYTRESPKGRRSIDIKQFLHKELSVDFNQEQVEIKLDILITPSGSVKPVEVLISLAENFALPINPADALIHRTGMFVKIGKETLSPFDAERIV